MQNIALNIIDCENNRHSSTYLKGIDECRFIFCLIAICLNCHLDFSFYGENTLFLNWRLLVMDRTGLPGR